MRAKRKPDATPIDVGECPPAMDLCGRTSIADRGGSLAPLLVLQPQLLFPRQLLVRLVALTVAAALPALRALTRRGHGRRNA